MVRSSFTKSVARRFASTRSRWLSIAAAGMAAISCSAADLGSPDDGSDLGPGATTNACFEGAPCLGGFCSEDGFCRSDDTALEKLLLEVTAPAGTHAIAGIRFLHALGDVPSSGGLDIELEHISIVEATVRGAPIPEQQCVRPSGERVAGTASDGTMSARVSLIPRESQLGLPAPTYSQEFPPSESSTYKIDLVAPPGRYDIHVEPLGADGDCVRPPYLILDQALADGDVSLNLQLPVPAKLDLSVVYPGYIDTLSQWQVDIVDRMRGTVLSNTVVLKDPVGLGGELEYTASLAYSPVDGDASEAATELVRLSPPDSVTAPTIYLDRSVIELFGAGEGIIDQLTSLPSPVSYTGRINQRDTITPAPGMVTLVATELASIDTGLLAVFSRTVQTDESGVFEVELLPGKYHVLMEPLSQELAQTVAELTISSDAGNQAGKVLEVGRRAHVAGTLVSLSGDPVLGVPIEAFPPALSLDVDVIMAARGASGLVPRAELVLPDEADSSAMDTGTFSLLADPGAFHLVARPEVATGFAWGVALGVEVEDENVGLRDIVLSPPFVLEGEIVSSDVGLVPGALVRAYAYVDGSDFASDVDEATSVVAVGEARADAEGRYRLLLPSVKP